MWGSRRFWGGIGCGCGFGSGGAGLTLACGSGACAAVVNAGRRGLVDTRVVVEMDGGKLEITVTDAGRVLMAGPAVTSFRGEVDVG